MREYNPFAELTETINKAFTYTPLTDAGYQASCIDDVIEWADSIDSLYSCVCARVLDWFGQLNVPGMCKKAMGGALVMSNMTPEELRKKFEWVKSCRCERPRCLQERERGQHNQSRTGCPRCDFAHGKYPLFTNDEVLQLFTDLCGEVIGENKETAQDFLNVPYARASQSSRDRANGLRDGFIQLRTEQLTRLNKLTGKEIKS